MRQTEYLHGVQAYYKENDIIPGDPNEGKWEHAHTPWPRGMGDNEVPLLRYNHVIHDLWQSIELDECHFFPDHAKAEIYGLLWPTGWFELADAYEHYRLQLSSKGGHSTKDKGMGIFARSFEEMSAHAKRNVERGIENGQPFWEVSHEERVKNGRKGGRKGGRAQSQQVWESTIDGYRSTSAGVANHNIQRGWDPSARVYIGQKPQ